MGGGRRKQDRPRVSEGKARTGHWPGTAGAHDLKLACSWKEERRQRVLGPLR